MLTTNETQQFIELLSELSDGWMSLPDKPEENPENTLRALWFCAAGSPKPLRQIDHDDLPSLDPFSSMRLCEMVSLRASGVPLAYITQHTCFMGIELRSSPAAMIPRKETEILGYAALDCVRALAAERNSVRVIDLCTGSGNLALALAYHEPRCTVIGADISRHATALAKRNAETLGLPQRVQFIESDLFAAFETPEFIGQVDLITCNPPYISTACVDSMAPEIAGYEPRAAFDGGPFGVNILTRLVREAPSFLKPNSWLAFEIGLGQDRAMARLIEKTAGYAHVRTICDAEGSTRAILARTNSR